MNSFDKTMRFQLPEEPEKENVKEILVTVHQALEEKGYQPINQIVGYLISGDPSYIPRHLDARNLIRKIERDEIIEEVLKFYLSHHQGEKP